jgi:hypothetical protein
MKWFRGEWLAHKRPDTGYSHGLTGTRERPGRSRRKNTDDGAGPPCGPAPSRVLLTQAGLTAPLSPSDPSPAPGATAS